MKLLLDHPTFARLNNAVTAVTDRFRLELRPFLIRAGSLTIEKDTATAIRRFRRRLEKHYGLRGKYVPH